MVRRSSAGLLLGLRIQVVPDYQKTIAPKEDRKCD